jgi:antirestriction protein ArdC
MKFYGKAECAAKQIVAAFQAGNLPQALAPIFVHRRDNVPMAGWSWHNQLLCVLAGCADARGYRQWEEVGRHVKKGQHAQAQILVPCTRKETATDDSGQETTRIRLYGFRAQPVFDVAQTEGEALAERDPENAAWLQSLPLRPVAEAWGLSVDCYSGKPGKALGWYRHKQAIALGVQNLATWAHELVHAADDRLGQLTERGQHWRSETVAELGSAILLECLGNPVEADLGGCWEYVSAYARDAGLEPITACNRVLKRTCDAVALILDTAATLAASQASIDEFTAEAEAVL